MSEQQENVITVTVRGTAMYPKNENGVMSYAIKLSPETVRKLNEVTTNVFDTVLSFGEDEADGGSLLNVKTKYTVPVYDPKTFAELENVKIRHGADVAASISIKEWKFRNKSGIHAYLRGIVLYQNGKESESATSYQSIMRNVL